MCMYRTVPSIGTLLECDADILQLDVTDVLEKGRKQQTAVGAEQKEQAGAL